MVERIEPGFCSEKISHSPGASSRPLPAASTYAAFDPMALISAPHTTASSSSGLCSSTDAR